MYYEKPFVYTDYTDLANVTRMSETEREMERKSGEKERVGRGHLNVIHASVKWRPAGFANELGICDPSYQRSFK